MHNDKVGYVRSMNPVAALLLVVLERNEENSFWVLASLVEDILFQGTYSRNLEGCQVGWVWEVQHTRWLGTCTP